jgi:hypothetical protein
MPQNNTFHRQPPTKHTEHQRASQIAARRAPNPHTDTGWLKTVQACDSRAYSSLNWPSQNVPPRSSSEGLVLQSTGKRTTHWMAGFKARCAVEPFPPTALGFFNLATFSWHCLQPVTEPCGIRQERKLLDLDASASGFDVCLDLVGIFFRNAFFEGRWATFDHLLGFHQ